MLFVAGAALALALGWFVWGRSQLALRSERDALSEKFAAASRDLAGAEVKAERLPDVELELAEVRKSPARLEAELAGQRAGAAERDRAHALQLQQMKEQFG